jgi:hypothetical protein
MNLFRIVALQMLMLVLQRVVRCLFKGSEIFVCVTDSPGSLSGIWLGRCGLGTWRTRDVFCNLAVLLPLPLFFRFAVLSLMTPLWFALDWLLNSPPCLGRAGYHLLLTFDGHLDASFFKLNSIARRLRKGTIRKTGLRLPRNRSLEATGLVLVPMPIANTRL